MAAAEIPSHARARGCGRSSHTHRKQLRTNPLELSAVVSALRKLRVTTDACGREATSRRRSMTAWSIG